MNDEIRRFVLDRDGFECMYCGNDDDLHVHHLKPRKEGGTDEPRNLITLCSSCHGKMEKHDERFQRKFLRRRGSMPFTLDGKLSDDGKPYYRDQNSRSWDG